MMNMVLMINRNIIMSFSFLIRLQHLCLICSLKFFLFLLFSIRLLFFALPPSGSFLLRVFEVKVIVVYLWCFDDSIWNQLIFWPFELLLLFFWVSWSYFWWFMSRGSRIILWSGYFRFSCSVVWIEFSQTQFQSFRSSWCEQSGRKSAQFFQKQDSGFYFIFWWDCPSNSYFSQFFQGKASFLKPTSGCCIDREGNTSVWRIRFDLFYWEDWIGLHSTNWWDFYWCRHIIWGCQVWGVGCDSNWS